MTNLRVAARALRKNAGFSTIVSVTMAVAIGASTAMFSIYDRLVLRPVTIPDPASLVAIWFNNPQRNTQSPSISVPRYEELRQQARSFASIGASTFDSFTLTGGGEPTLEANITQSLGTQRVVAALTALFAGLALALSLTGLCSVLAYAVSQRTPEIGIRMALGASRRQVVRLVMRDGLGLVAIGLTLGLAAAAAAARLIQQLLFGVGPLNPVVYTGVAVAVAALACPGP